MSLNENLGFKTPREIPENFLAFLMMSHKRVGAKSFGYQLSEDLYRHIFSFIRGMIELDYYLKYIEPRKFWLADLGSSFGTYIKLKSELIHPLEKGQTFLVGLDTYFNIIEVKIATVSIIIKIYIKSISSICVNFFLNLLYIWYHKDLILFRKNNK